MDSDEYEEAFGQYNPLKIFEQAVSGTNTYYQTHISWYSNPDTVKTQQDYPDERGFYVDVDFYNPSTTAWVDITIRNLVSANNDNDMRKYFGDLGGGANFTITLAPGQHKRLLSNDQYNNPLHITPWGPPTILFDFTVSGNNEVVISTLAAYSESNLVMKNAVIQNGVMIEDTKNKLHDGTILNNGDMVYSAKAYIKNDPTKRRPGEDDLYGKYKGIAKNQSAWIYVDTLEYFIDDSIASIPLPVNLNDSYY